MRVMLLGASGQVGRAVRAAVPAAHECVALDRAALDIRQTAQLLERLRATPCDWIVNAAAYTAVDAAEGDAFAAMAVNADAVAGIAAASRETGARLVQLSTDFVFDGSQGRAYEPESVPRPLGVYGRTKLEGERHALAAGGYVLRTSWVYASVGRNFVLTLLRLMRERDEVRVVSDQIGAPTWAAGLAGAIWALTERVPAQRILHWCDAGVASWYDFAVAIQEEALGRGLLTRQVPVRPIGTAEYPTRARRPAFSVLDCRSTVRALGSGPPHWRVQLRSMLDELRA